MGWVAPVAALGGLITSMAGLGYSVYQGETQKKEDFTYEPPDLGKVNSAAEDAAAKRRRMLAARYGRKQTNITGGLGDLNMGNILKTRLGG